MSCNASCASTRERSNAYRSVAIIPGTPPRRAAAALLWLGVALLTLAPAPLAAIATLYHALCVPFPSLLSWGDWFPPLPLALLLLVLGIVLVVGLVTGVRELIGTRRYVARSGAPGRPAHAGTRRRRVAWTRRAPDLSRHAGTGGVVLGLLRPRMTITAGLVDRLDDAGVDGGAPPRAAPPTAA